MKTSYVWTLKYVAVYSNKMNISEWNKRSGVKKRYSKFARKEEKSAKEIFLEDSYSEGYLKFFRENSKDFVKYGKRIIKM